MLRPLLLSQDVRPWLPIAGAMAIVLCGRMPVGATEVQLHLLDGRQISGVLDDASDDRDLWLRRSNDQILLAVPYRWNTISHATIDNTTVSVEQLQATYVDLTVPMPTHFLSELASEPTQAEHITAAQSRPPANPVPSINEVTTVTFAAVLAQWNEDAAADGYQILLAPLDADGVLTAARGTLTARLFGERRNRRGPIEVGVELERWTLRVERSDFTNGEASYRLPFRRFSPAEASHFGPTAILQLEVGVFGQGRFAASAEVPLRPCSPLRDRLQQQTGSRLLPVEQPLFAR